MIKLINYKQYGGREVYISKTMIHSMERNNDITDIIMEGGCGYAVKETPEEILAMLDIEDSNKVIDWEQRRYEIAKHILSKTFILGSPNGSANNAVRFADALIATLKGSISISGQTGPILICSVHPISVLIIR